VCVCVSHTLSVINSERPLDDEGIVKSIKGSEGEGY